jgi:DNA-binding MarR family transcriptional regulator
MPLMKMDAKQTLGFLLHDAQRLMRRRFEHRGSVYGLSSAQWRLLVYAVREEGVPQARLAALLEIEPISVSRLLDRMEDNGWIERRSDASDRRVRTVWPSAKGRAAFDSVKEMAGDIYEKAMKGMSPEQRAGLLEGLSTIIENMSEADRLARCENEPLKGKVA